MAIFNFSVKSTRVNKNKSSGNPKTKYSIIQKDVRGVIWVTTDAFYKVVVGDDVYDITERSFRCENKKTLYYEDLIDDRVTMHITVEAAKGFIKGKLPFTVGCSVTGTIVKRLSDDKVLFNIKTVYMDCTNPNARRAYEFYKENRDKILKSKEERENKL